MLGLLLAACGGAQESTRLSVSERVVLAGAPTTAELHALAGSQTVVIDLRPQKETDDVLREQRLLEQQGTMHVHLPMTPGARLDPLVELLDRTLEETGDRPVLLHCASGTRAALLWGARLVTHGATLDDAFANVDGLLERESARQALREFATRSETGAGAPAP